MNQEAKTKIVSYVVSADGDQPGKDALDKAMAEGYSVVDIIHTPIPAGGGATGNSGVCVTVYLTNESATSGQTAYYAATRRTK